MVQIGVKRVEFPQQEVNILMTQLAIGKVAIIMQTTHN